MERGQKYQFKDLTMFFVIDRYQDELGLYVNVFDNKNNQVTEQILPFTSEAGHAWSFFMQLLEAANLD